MRQRNETNKQAEKQQNNKQARNQPTKQTSNQTNKRTSNQAKTQAGEQAQTNKQKKQAGTVVKKPSVLGEWLITFRDKHILNYYKMI